MCIKEIQLFSGAWELREEADPWTGDVTEDFVGTAPFQSIGRERVPVREGPWAGMVPLIHGLSRVMDSAAC